LSNPKDKSLNLSTEFLFSDEGVQNMKHYQVRKKVLRSLLVTGILVSVLGGCMKLEPAKLRTEMAVEPVPAMTLAAGDVIDVKFFYMPELDESQKVRPDGRIALQLIGEVNVLGKTSEDLRGELVGLYSARLKHPEISVFVRRLDNSKVYVGGEVKKPGSVEMSGKLTVMDAVMEVGGFKPESAELSTIVIIRNRNGKHYGCLFDAEEVLAGKMAEPFYLQPRDIVYVPRTKIVQANQFIEQYINKMVPQVDVFFTYPFGPGKLGRVGVDTSQGGGF
jgi:polysaccharide biosynthesis/export protein